MRSKTALAIAGATVMMGVSPAPGPLFAYLLYWCFVAQMSYVLLATALVAPLILAARLPKMPEE